MPFVTIRMYPGRDDELKTKMAEAAAEGISSALGIAKETVTVSVEEISPEEYAPIMDSLDRDSLYLKEGKRVR